MKSTSHLGIQPSNGDGYVDITGVDGVSVRVSGLNSEMVVRTAMRLTDCWNACIRLGEAPGVAISIAYLFLRAVETGSLDGESYKYYVRKAIDALSRGENHDGGVR